MSNQPKVIQYVVGFLFDDDQGDQLVLIRKTHPPWQAGKLNGVGGHVHDGEEPLAAMRREFEEETGVYILTWTYFAKLQGVNEGTVIGDFEVWQVHFFYAVHSSKVDSVMEIAEHVAQQGTSLDHEFCEVVNPCDLPSDVLPNLNWLVPMARYHSIDRATYFVITEKYS